MNELIQLNASSLTGKKYWRSLDQLSNTPEFRQWVEREFQEGASELMNGASRRNMLKLMAAEIKEIRPRKTKSGSAGAPAAS